LAFINLDFIFLDLKFLQSVIQNQLIVYPNPSQDGIFRLATNSNEIHWTVFDMKGKQILQGNTSLVDLSFSPKGIYVISVCL